MFSITRTHKIAIAALILVCLFASGVVYVFRSPTGFVAKRNSDLAQIDARDEAKYTDLSGNTIDVLEYHGGVFVVTVWASWSPFSKNDFIVLDTLKEKYGESLRVVALNRMETPDTAKAYLAYIEAPDTVEYIIDETDAFFVAHEGYAMPETFVYDQVGNVIYHTRGTLTFEEIDEVLRNTLTP